MKTKLPLTSDHFKDDDRLQSCLILDRDHVIPGERGAHVAKIQKALIMLGAAVIAPGEIKATHYGTSTASAVLRFKGPPRNIINKSYQKTPDNIVGKMTIAVLDSEIKRLETRPESRLVSVTEAGPKHDHAQCPRLESGIHLGTPINPQGFGRMINIFGDHETDYLGFEDFSTDERFTLRSSGPRSRLTFDTPFSRGLEREIASDICMRSSPVTDESFTKLTGKPNTIDEIKRNAMPGCRLTYSGPDDNIRVFGPKIVRLGVLLETVVIKKPASVEPLGTVVPESIFIALVVGLLGFPPQRR